MKNAYFSIKEWGERALLALFLRKYDIFDTIKLEVRNFEADGLILDIGGGGEGVIGRLKGRQVVAIDLHQDELDGTPNGPQKIVMDARNLQFPDEHFATATAFFALLYMKTQEDHQKVLKEAWRVLKPAGRLLLWDVDLSNRPSRHKEFYLVRLRYRVGNFEKGTGYGVRWPKELRDEAYYIQIAEDAGFRHLATERRAGAFYLEFVKPG